MYFAAMLGGIIESTGKRDRAVARKKVMKTAGAARLLSAVHGIYFAVISEAGKPPEDRLGRLVVPDVLPSLETISTQDNDVISEFSEFLASASRLDAHTVLETWPYDPNKTHPDEQAATDDLIEKWKKLQDKLESVAAGGQP